MLSHPLIFNQRHSISILLLYLCTNIACIPSYYHIKEHIHTNPHVCMHKHVKNCQLFFSSAYSSTPSSPLRISFPSTLLHSYPLPITFRSNFLLPSLYLLFLLPPFPSVSDPTQSPPLFSVIASSSPTLSSSFHKLTYSSHSCSFCLLPSPVLTHHVGPHGTSSGQRTWRYKLTQNSSVFCFQIGTAL